MSGWRKYLASTSDWVVLWVGMKPKITVYVRSMRVLVSETLVEEPYPTKKGYGPYEVSKYIMFQTKLKKKYSYVLPDDQKALVEVVKRLSERCGFELQVIDVAKETIIQRLWRELKWIKNFPVVETNRGGRLQAPFSQSELERFISQ